MIIFIQYVIFIVEINSSCYKYLLIYYILYHTLFVTLIENIDL